MGDTLLSEERQPTDCCSGKESIVIDQAHH